MSDINKCDSPGAGSVAFLPQVFDNDIGMKTEFSCRRCGTTCQ